LHSQFGGKFTINATAVFDYPTIGGLGEYLAAQLPDAESESESGAVESVEAPDAGPESEATSQTAAEPESNGAHAETEAPSQSDEAEASSDATA
jgi:hypothetical protein